MSENDLKCLFLTKADRLNQRVAADVLELISADFVIKVHLDLQDELQLLVGHKCGQRAVDLLTRVDGLPVVLVPQVDFVAAGCFLVVVPPAGTFLCGRTARY